MAEEGSKLTLTGSGTFVPGAPNGDVTGGGTYVLRNPQGSITDSGTFRVTGLISWNLAPGGFAPGTPDKIGNAADASDRRIRREPDAVQFLRLVKDENQMEVDKTS